mmetsp:Transcript_36888/g.82994  ORF Transcript_36888/g.82994 Transcript_36888/m.82994 type:complete len:725 (-) Transcript_36888:117-2291(-)
MRKHRIAAVLSALGVVSSSSTITSTDAGCFPVDGSFQPNDWAHCQPISGSLTLYYTPLDDLVMIGLHASQDVFGWSALGIAGNGGMKGSSQIVVRRGDNEDEWVAEDMYSFDYTKPIADVQQDVQLLFARQDDVTGETAWGVVVPKNSCDEPFDYDIEDRSVFMIWALGDSHDFSFHGGRRGQFTANLLAPPAEHADFSQYKHVDFLMPNVEVTRGEEEVARGEDITNAFICTYFDLDVMAMDMNVTHEDKIHVVGFEPKIEEGNEEYYHHMLLSSCGGAGFDPGNGGGTFDESEIFHKKVIPNCQTVPRGCQNNWAAHAVGADSEGLPPNVGIPIGEGERWVVMQLHYYNPRKDEGIYDSSGMRVFMTSELRPIDAGRMAFAVGVSEGQHPPIPGGQKEVSMETLFVEPECSEQWAEPLNIISVGHHSHFHGLHQDVTVERNGVNLGPMRKEYRYDYNHQGGVQPVTALKQLLPGDRLAATCYFNTESISSDSVIEIGEESNKEMCFPTILYYPKQDSAGVFAYSTPERLVKRRFIEDYTWCSMSSGDESFGSMCEEKLYSDVTSFYKTMLQGRGFNMPSIGLQALCGSSMAASIKKRLQLCPEECDDIGQCSDDEIRTHALATCERVCSQIGVTLYPDTSRTEIYNSVNAFCPTRMFDAPTLATPQTCKARGKLPVPLSELLAVNPNSTLEGENELIRNGAPSIALSTFLAGLVFLVLLDLD